MTSGRFHPEGGNHDDSGCFHAAPDQQARYQEAQVQDDEAKARKAAADAAMSELTLTQARYKALVPDLTGVATNAVTDKSAGVAFSGLVTHSALNNAAKVIADRIAAKLPARTRPPAGHPGHIADRPAHQRSAVHHGEGLPETAPRARQAGAGAD